MKGCHLEKWLISGSVLYALFSSNLTIAQVVGDTTLPVGERSQVTGNPNFQIDGGATRGGNLFHSFSQFSVPTGGSAYFNNAADVQNIFSRVTGGSISNIDGLIRANGTANLFLLNPNGIIFGANASLDIGGSFVATTANAIGFGNGEFFSSDATQSVPSQLLRVNPNALFFNQQNPQPIVNQSSANNTGLQVPLRQNLLLVGGAVQLNNGQIISPGSYVEIGSVGGVGTVGLSTTGEDWQLNIPNGVTRADVSLRNGSDINVKGDGGSIRILGQNIESDRSSLRIEIPSNSRLPDTQSGDLELDATRSISISNSTLANSLFGQGTMGGINLSAGDRISLDGSDVYNTLEQTGVGKVGDINITTGSLSLTRGDAWFSYNRLASQTKGQGNVGSVNINARDTVSSDGTLVFNTVEPTGIGNGGDINITTGSLSLTSGAEVVSKTSGRGNAGSVNINARNTVSFDGSTVYNTVDPIGIGNADGINITTGSLSLTSGAHVNSNTSGRGNAGSVNINARDTVSIDDSSVFNTLGIEFNTLERRDVGKVGDINITTGSLSLTSGAEVVSVTYGQGNAGSVNINARDRVFVDGDAPYFGPYRRASTIYTRVEPNAVGQGGNVTIATGSLFLTNGGAVFTDNDSGIGNAGRVTIHARDSVQISGTAPTFKLIRDNRSGVVTSVSPSAVGNGGDVTITTGSLSVSEQGRIATNVEGQGTAGNIKIQATETVSFDGGDAISTLELGAKGSGGNIDITTRSLSLLNGAQLSTSTRGQGNAGNVTVNAQDTVSLAGANLVSPSAITTQVEAGAVGDGGKINITTGSVSLTDGAQLATTTLSQGRAGDISINATDQVVISGTDPNYSNRVPQLDSEISVINVGPASGLYANTESNSVGRGGDIQVATGQLTVEEGARMVASTAGEGNAGNIRVEAAEAVTLSGTSPYGFSSGLLTNTERTAAGVGGEIRVDTNALQVREGAVLSARSSGTARGGEIIVKADTVDLTTGGQFLTTAFSSGQAGNITVNASDRIQIAGTDSTFEARLTQFGRPAVDSVSAASGVFTNTEANSSGVGGAITLTSGSLSLLDGGRLVASTAGQGDAGNITVNSSNLQLSGASSGLFTQASSSANAGNLTIQPQGNGQSVTVQLQEGAKISASTAGGGRGGTLTITAPELITLTGNGSIISAETSGSGTGGNLNLRTGTLNIQNQAEVTVSSEGTGSAGSLFVNANQIYLNNGGRIRADTSGGGGNIYLRSPLILLRNGSRISTNAIGINIPGGNINIDTDNLVAVPKENSDITANSEDFRGGNVTIRTNGIFGIEFREQLTSLSDITATGVNSEFPGTVNIITAGIDPSRGLAQLPTDVGDASDAIAQSCRDVRDSSFVVTGRGGLPPTPQQALGDDPRWRDWRTPAVVSHQPNAPRYGTLPPSAHSASTKSALVEATGWMFAANGQVILTASAPNVTSLNRWGQPVNCDGS
jgi:filamentous hemagglutinin family protein